MTVSGDVTLAPSEDTLGDVDGIHYELTLFVGGASEISARAIANARRMCDVHLDDRVRLNVVDVHESPAAVLDGRVLVAPTLVKDWPLPERRVIGDISHIDQVMLALDLPLAKHVPRAE
jgi:circadian clock protein KaiB